MVPRDIGGGSAMKATILTAAILLSGCSPTYYAPPATAIGAGEYYGEGLNEGVNDEIGGAMNDADDYDSGQSSYYLYESSPSSGGSSFDRSESSDDSYSPSGGYEPAGGAVR
jgi:hypothetical protein